MRLKKTEAGRGYEHSVYGRAGDFRICAGNSSRGGIDSHLRAVLVMEGTISAFSTMRGTIGEVYTWGDVLPLAIKELANEAA